MGYMGNYYWTRNSHELKILHSKKYNRLTKLHREAKTYLNMQEIKKLTEQMRWIEAVLEARRLQTEFDVE